MDMYIITFPDTTQKSIVTKLHHKDAEVRVRVRRSGQQQQHETLVLLKWETHFHLTKHTCLYRCFLTNTRDTFTPFSLAHDFWNVDTSLTLNGKLKKNVDESKRVETDVTR